MSRQGGCRKGAALWPWIAAVALTVAGGALAQPTKTIRGFADFNFGTSDADGQHSQFGLGEYDTYITGTLDERLSYLSEVTFEYEKSGWGLAVERLWVRYYFGEALSASVGKFHTAMGHWNRAYHHGSLLFDSVDKPLTRRLFPIHTTGLLLSGRELTGLRLYYDLMVGNGVASTPKTDDDDRKSINLHLYSKLVEGADIGVSIFVDQVPGGTYGAGKIASGTHGPSEIGAQRAVLGEDIDLVILAPFFALRQRRLSLEVEAALANSEGRDSGSSEWATAAYFLASYDLDPFVPFAKFDYLKTEASDPLYNLADTKAYAVGLRYDLAALAALKAQYTYRDAGGGANVLALQLAVGL